MAAQPTKVALITGGGECSRGHASFFPTRRTDQATPPAGGLGLAVAQALAARGGWQIHLLDVKEDEGREAAASLQLRPGAAFHRADLTRYDELSAAFAAAYAAGGNRLDFVHANGGVIERSSMYELKSDSGTTAAETSDRPNTNPPLPLPLPLPQTPIPISSPEEAGERASGFVSWPGRQKKR